jgi:pimeloyl-ACP methyl ester carboxylesterase
VITAEMTRELVEDLGPKAKFVELKDCGHSPLIDDLPQLLNEVTNFLKTEVFK